MHEWDRYVLKVSHYHCVTALNRYIKGDAEWRIILTLRRFAREEQHFCYLCVNVSVPAHFVKVFAPHMYGYHYAQIAWFSSERERIGSVTTKKNLEYSWVSPSSVARSHLASNLHNEHNRPSESVPFNGVLNHAFELVWEKKNLEDAGVSPSSVERNSVIGPRVHCLLDVSLASVFCKCFNRASRKWTSVRATSAVSRHPRILTASTAVKCPLMMHMMMVMMMA